MNAQAYYQALHQAISNNPFVLSFDLQFREIDESECYIRGVLQLAGNLQLHVAEYVLTAPSIERLKYRYHLQRPDATLVARWDNVQHHSHISTFPHHRHDGNDDVYPSPKMDIPAALAAILPLTTSEE